MITILVKKMVIFQQKSVLLQLIAIVLRSDV